jgi:CBS domain containing-hemolysin-like protein
MERNRAYGMDRARFRALVVGLWALVLAALSGLASQTVIAGISLLPVAFAALLVVMLIGIVFDVVGVAVAAANEAPLHAKAARKEFGAQHAVGLVKDAPRVASSCADLIGDVSGTLSGAIGVTIVVKLFADASQGSRLWAAILMTALVAAVIVTGKALGKAYAIAEGTLIVTWVGRLLAWTEKWLHVRVVLTTDARRRRKRRHRIAVPGQHHTKPR